MSDFNPTDSDSGRGERSEFLRAFSDMLRLPRAYWFVMAAYVGDSMAYFGMLALMTVYLGADMAWEDYSAGLTASI